MYVEAWTCDRMHGEQQTRGMEFGLATLICVESVEAQFESGAEQSTWHACSVDQIIQFTLSVAIPSKGYSTPAQGPSIMIL